MGRWSRRRGEDDEKDEEEDSLGSRTEEGSVLGLIYYEGGRSADGSDEGDVREALAVEELASEEEEQVTVGWRGLVEGECLERRVVERISTEERLEWWRKERIAPVEPRERHAVPPRERPEREDRLEAQAPKAQELLRSY